jgi:hypothetical protein
MQPGTAPFQPQYLQQQPQYYNQGMPPAMYYTVPPNQPIQQQPQPTQTSNPAIQRNNLNKPKPKRTSKIAIRDPKDNKDVTEQILSHTNAANGRSGSTPPLTNSTAQTESSTIQAQFAAQVAARVGGEKVNMKTLNKVNSSAVENRTDSPKNTTNNTHLSGKDVEDIEDAWDDW